MCRVVNILLALLSRLLFAVHGFLTVSLIVLMTCNYIYWLLIIGVVLLAVEMVITIKYTRKAEWKWFSPMIFLYLSTMIPSIWVMELHLSHNKPFCNQSIKEPSKSVDFLEKTMIIVLVIGRWLMPKGDMSHGHLAKLLLVYVGLGTDILDILATFRNDEVKKDDTLITAGLTLICWALMQFPFVLIKRNLKSTSSNTSCYSETWSILTDAFQDGPFLMYRMYIMINKNVLEGDTIFFTSKNTLIVMLGLYRFVMVYCGQHSPEEREEMAETGI